MHVSVAYCAEWNDKTYGAMPVSYCALRVVADATKAHKELAWAPVFTTLDEIVAHAWRWELKQH